MKPPVPVLTPTSLSPISLSTVEPAASLSLAALPPAGAGCVADSVTAFARRRGVPADDETSIVDLLSALDHNPLLPHRMVLVAGSVMARAFRHDRTLAEPDLESQGASRSTADRSF
jgi:Uncharacterized homolog of the cytoplasmic domain of flagellar protein FhlB